MDVQPPTTVGPLPLSTPTLTPSTIATITTVQQAPTPPTTAPSTLLQNLPNFGLLFGFDHRLKTLEDNFSEFVQTNQFAGAVSSIPGIVQRYMDQRMNEAVKIIKAKVKEQVKVQVSNILSTIEQTMNKQLKAEVLTWSSNSSKTYYVVATDLSEMELKKILIEKMEGNKSIPRSNKHRNLYKSLVEAYESDKIILDTYGDTVMLKRRRVDDADKDKEPFVRSDRGESATADKPVQTTHEMEAPSHLEFETRADDQPIVEPSQDDDKLYKFKEGDFKRLRIQDIEDMLLLLVQGKLTNLTVEERFAFNVSLRMFTRSIIIQIRVKDLQLGVESYQKKLNLTRPDTYRSDLKRKEAYTAYSNLKGFIY
nr:hypothetical protein [Tanacetum cinerariifolium]